MSTYASLQLRISGQLYVRGIKNTGNLEMARAVSFTCYWTKFSKLRLRRETTHGVLHRSILRIYRDNQCCLEFGPRGWERSQFGQVSGSNVDTAYTPYPSQAGVTGCGSPRDAAYASMGHDAAVGGSKAWKKYQRRLARTSQTTNPQELQNPQRVGIRWLRL